MTKIDYEKEIGKKYGKLFVESLCFGRHTLANCKCDCGQKTSVLLHNLRSGRTKSCGCLSLELLNDRQLQMKDRMKKTHDLQTYPYPAFAVATVATLV